MEVTKETKSFNQLRLLCVEKVLHRGNEGDEDTCLALCGEF